MINDIELYHIFALTDFIPVSTYINNQFKSVLWHNTASIITDCSTKMTNCWECTFEHINPHVNTNHNSKLPPNFWSLKGKNSVRSGLVINEQKYIICWLCSSRKKKMTAINIISVGVNCPELTPPKASWQTEGTEETHSLLSLGWDKDIYSTGNQQGSITALLILIAVTVKQCLCILPCYKS